MPRRLRLTRGVVLALVGAACGALVFHLLVMPVFVRRGAETEVPELEGEPASGVEAVLAPRGLRVGQIVRAYDEQIEAGCVVRHSPPAGLHVKRGRAIDLLVSLGPATLCVPELEGESMAHARFLLQKSGLTVGRVRSVEDPRISSDRVIAADPPARTRLGGRSAVDLLVSSGSLPTRFIMPDLRGANGDDAESALRRVGFRVTRHTTRRGGGRAGSVQEQAPPPGNAVRMGSEVELGVAG
jgi:beta-lactam-binding protein with PASTA domain